MLQLLVAGAMIGMKLPPVLRSVHQAVGVSIWISTFAFAYIAWIGSRPVVEDRGRVAGQAVERTAKDNRAPVAQHPRARMIDAAVEVSGMRAVARDLVSLTKPRIISLLLVTTIAPMYVAGHPSWQLVLAVFVGGYLMAGGANTVNMYLDRDIDERMARTRLRPIPSGRMHPKVVLAFGVFLATGATFLLANVANVLTAALALAGFYFYVFIYTRWLKRTTPQNIVIGGAAGAFPPLVGWAAVTGRIDLAAVYLFLIIFYWTPPHFWALALLKQRDYGKPACRWRRWCGARRRRSGRCSGTR